MQIWKFHRIFEFIWKQFPENFANLILRIIELFPVNFDQLQEDGQIVLRILRVDRQILGVDRRVRWVNKRGLQVEKRVLWVGKRVLRVGEKYYEWPGK